MKKQIKMFLMILIALFIVLPTTGFAETTHWELDGNWDKFTLYYETGGETSTLDFLPVDITVDVNKFKAIGPPNLVVGKTYNVTMTTWFKNMESAASNPIFIYTKVLNIPSDVTLVNGVLTWIAPTGSFDGYLITYSIDGVVSEIDIGADVLTAIIPMPCGGKDYLVSMKSTLKEVFSESSPVILGITPPCPPTNVRVVFE